MKSKLNLLLKIGMKTSFFGGVQDVPEKKQAKLAEKSGDAGAVTYKNYKRVSRVTTILILFVLVAGLAFFFFNFLGSALKTTGMLNLLPTMAMCIASITTLILSILKVNGLLFGFRDFDMLMSLPVKTGTVVASRMLMLYGMNVAFCLILMVPSAVAYAIYAAPPFMFYISFILCLIFTPVLPVAIATIIGSLIAVASSHFKRRGIVTIVMTVIAMVAWVLFAANMSTIVAQVAGAGKSILSSIENVYFPAVWYEHAVCGGDAVSLLLFIGVSIAVFILYIAVVAGRFKKINTMITAKRAVSNYKIHDMKTRGQIQSLFRKEWKRFVSSTPYIMNAGFGIIVLFLLSVVAMIFGPKKIADALGYSFLGNAIASVAPTIMGFCIVQVFPAASSISLEGKNLWILKSIPLNTKDILRAKLRVNLLLTFAGGLICSVMQLFAVHPDLSGAIMLFVMPLAYGAFISTFGLRMNLSHPNFHWDSEVKAVKSGTSVTTTIFTGMGVSIIPLVGTLILGSIVLYVTTAGLIIASLLLYRSIMTDGVKTFDSYMA